MRDTRGVVSRREFEPIPVGGDDGLREDELDHLARLRRGGPAFYTEERRDGRWYCRFAGFAGAIALPGGRTLEILPKVSGTAGVADRGPVMRMLAATGLTPSIEHDLAEYASSPHLIEAYLRLAADLAARYLRRVGSCMPTGGSSSACRWSGVTGGGILGQRGGAIVGRPGAARWCEQGGPPVGSGPFLLATSTMPGRQRGPRAHDAALPEGSAAWSSADVVPTAVRGG